MGDQVANDIRHRLTAKYVGHAGIHGIGVSRRNNQYYIAVYAVDRVSALEQIFQELAADAHPYKVNLIIEQSPSIK